MPIDDLKILKISGTAIPVIGDNIDTDQITPADAMTETSFANAVHYLFRDARSADPNHSLNDSRYNGASIMIVNKNFGSGSSRETAPQAIARYGIKALVGESYAAIFEGNCRALGIPAVATSSDDIKRIMEFTENSPQTPYTLDLESMVVIYRSPRKFSKYFIEKLPASLDKMPPYFTRLLTFLLYKKNNVNVSMPESSRKALMEGQWDALSMLKANEGMVKEVAGRLPYMNGFAN